MEQKYSKLAIISFIIIIPLILIFVILFFYSLFLAIKSYDISTFFTAFIGLLILIAGFISIFSLSFLFIIIPIISIILAIISLFKIKKYNLKGKRLAIAAIIISILLEILYVYLINLSSNLRF